MSTGAGAEGRTVVQEMAMATATIVVWIVLRWRYQRFYYSLLNELKIYSNVKYKIGEKSCWKHPCPPFPYMRKYLRENCTKTHTYIHTGKYNFEFFAIVSISGRHVSVWRSKRCNAFF